MSNIYLLHISSVGPMAIKIVLPGSFVSRDADCSYGPGRYDPEYEERGHDYPASYVRWTEQRNMQAVLDLMASGKLDVSPLISHRFKIENAESAYDLIEKGKDPYLGILLEYPEVSSLGRRIELKPGFLARPEKEEFNPHSAIRNPQSVLVFSVPEISPG